MKLSETLTGTANGRSRSDCGHCLSF